MSAILKLPQKSTAPSVKIDLHAIEAEEAVLGCMIASMQACNVARMQMVENDFFIQRNALLFDTMCSMVNDGLDVDYLSLANALTQRGKLSEVGGTAYLTQLINAAPIFEHIDTYIRLVQNMAARRRIFKAAEDIANLCISSELTATNVQEHAADLLNKAMNRDDLHAIGPVSSARLANVVANNIIDWSFDPKEVRGWRSGITALDRATGGMMTSQFWTIIGRTGSGKTTMLRAIIHHLQTQTPVIVFPTEQSTEQYMINLYSYVLGVSYRDIVCGKVSDDAIDRAKQILQKWNVTFYDKENPTTSEVIAFCREQRRANGAKAVIVDGLGDMSASGDIYQATVERTAALHSLARAGFLVVTTVQANRGVEDRRRKNPNMNDAQGGHIIAQKTTHFLALYRPGYEIETQEREGDDSIDPTEVQIHILKDRFFNSQGTVIKGRWEPGQGFKEKLS